MDGLSRLLDLGFLLQRHGITLAPGSKDGARPWLHHALMGTGPAAAGTGSAARLSDAFIHAHSRLAA